MELFKIQHELIADRPAEAWYRLNSSGPSFHYRWSFGTRGADGERFSDIMSEHYDHAVCREEPSLTMAWGMPVDDDRDRDETQYEWASAFIDSKVRPFWVDFFWNNALIDRVELCSVDGGHGIIPPPDYRLEVSDFEVAVARLVHDLNGSLDQAPEHYLDMIEARRVRDQDRSGAGTH